MVIVQPKVSVVPRQGDPWVGPQMYLGAVTAFEVALATGQPGFWSRSCI